MNYFGPKIGLEWEDQETRIGHHSPVSDQNNSSNNSFYDDEPFIVFHFGSTRRGFTDPFDLFRRVFADELTGGGAQSGLLFPQRRHRDMFFGGGVLI
jgi:hypothetical protein